MNIEIIRQSRGEFNTHVSFNADGVYHTAIVYVPDDGADVSEIRGMLNDGNQVLASIVPNPVGSRAKRRLGSLLLFHAGIP